MKKNKKEKVQLDAQEQKKRNAKRTRAAVSCFILILGIGIAGNWYWENSDLSARISSISTDKEKILGEASFVGATTENVSENEYFSQARVERQNARDESLEKLQKIVDSQTETKEAKKIASDRIAAISDAITVENKIETLVKAKGINNCLAVINQDSTRVDVIIDVKDLSDSVILQVKEIAVEQMGCTYENVTIIQSN